MSAAIIGLAGVVTAALLALLGTRRTAKSNELGLAVEDSRAMRVELRAEASELRIEADALRAETAALRAVAVAVRTEVDEMRRSLVACERANLRLRRRLANAGVEEE